MSWFQRHKTDEHNTPTEPLPYLEPTRVAPSEPAYPSAWPTPQEDYSYLPLVPNEARSRVRASRRLRTQRSVLPVFVGFFFVIVQCLLLARFGLRLFDMEESGAWAELVYAISGLFVWPFANLWQYVPVQWPENLEVYTLLAVLTYGLFSRILVRILKIILNG